jgi:outer membrane protein OmpA-like peptidoglycan-associated protein
LGFLPDKKPLATQFAHEVLHMLIKKFLLSFIVFSTLQAQDREQKAGIEKPARVKEVYNSTSKKQLTYYIVFDSGKTILNKEAIEKLDRIIKTFKNNLSDTIDVKSGSEKNALYKERSLAVNNYLASKGVPQPQIRFIECGNLKTPKGIELILKE